MVKNRWGWYGWGGSNERDVVIGKGGAVGKWVGLKRGNRIHT